jgi:hypothetical protein
MGIPGFEPGFSFENLILIQACKPIPPNPLKNGWARRELNSLPEVYKSPALTDELLAHMRTIGVDEHNYGHLSWYSLSADYRNRTDETPHYKCGALPLG